jgi:hypothetical protein
MSDHCSKTYLDNQEIGMSYHVPVPSVSAFKRFLAAVAVASVGLLAGCGSKPPGCADSAVKTAVIDTVVQLAIKRNGLGDSPMGTYIKNLKADLVGVTTSGYDEGARKHTCQATLALTDTHETTSVPLAYTVQGIEGSRGEYEVAYYDKGYPLHLTMVGLAQTGLAYEEKQRKPGATAAEIAAKVPAENSEAEPAPVMAGQRPPEPAAAAVVTPSPVGLAPAVPETKASLQSSATTASGKTSPSFSCEAKLSSTEQMICETATLSEADALMARLYAATVGKAGDAAAVRQQQRDWRKLRDMCRDVACLQAAYGKRNEELSH